jgi:hypothetical protein
METLPCRHCGHEVADMPPRCPYCAREDRAKPAYGPARKAKSQAPAWLFGMASMGTAAAIVFGVWALFE